MASGFNWNRIARRIRIPLGFVLAGLYVWLARPTWISLGLGTLLVSVGVGVRAVASGYVRKNEELAMTGPYRFTRNPLYLGSMVLGLGFAVAARSPWIGMAMLGLFFAVYLPVIRAEEVFLRARFPEYDEYARRVPRLWPRPWATDAGDEGEAIGRAEFSWPLYRQHREYNAGLGAGAMVAVLVILRLWRG